MQQKDIITGILPTFYLKGVNQQNTTNKYLSGYFNNISLPDVNTKKIIRPNDIYHISNNSELNDTFIFKDKNNTPHSLYTTNTSSYRMFLGDGNNPINGGHCEWCNISFTHTALGIPIRHVIMSNPNIPREKLNIFYIDDTVLCSFECAKAYIIKNINKGYMISSPFYKDSLTFLTRIFDIMYSYQKEIIPAPDPHLLKLNNGSINIEEFKSEKNLFVKTPNLLLPPSKYIYEKLQIRSI
jgi:hypothetical protein